MAGSVLKILRNESEGDGKVTPPAEGEPAGLVADPKPAKQSRRAKPTAAQVRSISTELQVGLKFIAGAWSMRDQHCAPVLNEHSKAISDELAVILAEHPKVAAWFEGVSGFGSWFRLLMVVQPLVEAIMDHHVFRSVSRETSANPEDTGNGDQLSYLPPFHPGERYAS